MPKASIIVAFLALITVSLNRAQTTINWAGYQWIVRNQQNSGPGPNDWSPNNVWLDANNNLHLKLTYSATTGRWTCAEVYSTNKFGFGSFRWFVEGPIDRFDPNVVLGLFTYGGVDGINEIDIEVAKWGQTASNVDRLYYTVYPNSANVAQPVSAGTLVSLQGTYTTHRFSWTSTNVAFKSQHGFMTSTTANVFFSYETPSKFTTAVPYTSVPIHMNLWLFQGRPPLNGQEVEIIIHDFSYTSA